jgi:hypothetical protein
MNARRGEEGEDIIVLHVHCRSVIVRSSGWAASLRIMRLSVLVLGSCWLFLFGRGGS